MTEDDGLVPIDTNLVSPETVDMVITSVSKQTDINQAGGDTIIITGTGFPASLDSRYEFSITLGGTTSCTII